MAWQVQLASFGWQRRTEFLSCSEGLEARKAQGLNQGSIEQVPWFAMELFFFGLMKEADGWRTLKRNHRGPATGEKSVVGGMFGAEDASRAGGRR